MEFFSDFEPVWAALGAGSGREYCRERSRQAVIRNQKRINVVAQDSARRLFLFQACVKDPGDSARGGAAFARAAQLGGDVLQRERERTRVELEHAYDRGERHGDDSYDELVSRRMFRYGQVRAIYEERERLERAHLERVAKAVLDEYREHNPHTGLAEQWHFMGVMCHVMHNQDLEAISDDDS